MKRTRRGMHCVLLAALVPVTSIASLASGQVNTTEVITGVLTSRTGIPASGACVLLAPIGDQFNDNSIDPPAVRADAHGRWTVRVDQGPDYPTVGYFMVIDACNTPAPVASEVYKHVTAPPGQGHANNYFGTGASIVLGYRGRTHNLGVWKLLDQSRIVGHVLIPAGPGDAALCVQADDQQGNIYQSPVAANGTYVIKNLPGGPHHIDLFADCDLGVNSLIALTTLAPTVITTRVGETVHHNIL